MLNSILLAEAAPQGNGMGSILMIVALIAIFYFFMIRPQSQQRKKMREFHESIKVGDKLITVGGVHGKVKKVNPDTLLLEIASGVTIKVNKSSVYANSVDADMSEEKTKLTEANNQ